MLLLETFVVRIRTCFVVPGLDAWEVQNSAHSNNSAVCKLLLTSCYLAGPS